MSGKDKDFHVLGGKGNLAGKSDFKRRVKKKEVKDTEIELFNYYDKNNDGKLSKKEMDCIFNDISGYIERYDDEIIKNQEKTVVHKTSMYGHDALHEIEKFRIKLRHEGKSQKEIDAQMTELMRRMKPEASSEKHNDEIDKVIKSFKKHQQDDLKALTKELSLEFQLKEVNSSFTPKDIRQFLQERGLEGKVRIVDVANFINRMSLKSNAKDLKNKIQKDDENTLKAIENLPAENAVAFIQQYGKGLFTNSIFRDIKHTDNAEEGFAIVGDKLEQQAVMMGLPSDKVKAFREEYNQLAADGKVKKLNKLVDDLAKQLEPYEKTYQENRNGILTMMANDKLTWSNETNTKNKSGNYTNRYDYTDKYRQLNDMMYYIQKNNPREMLSGIANDSNNPKAKMARNLLESSYLDHYPIFVASLISQESRYGEHHEQLYTVNGQGPMQLTKIMIEDMYNRPGFYDKETIEHLKQTYKTPEELYSKLKDNDTDNKLNLLLGTIGLRAKLNESMGIASRKSGDVSRHIDVTKPEALLEFTALNYNGNRRRSYNGSNSQVRYDYGRDVIKRFDNHLPDDAKVKHYFEYNPKNGRFINY